MFRKTGQTKVGLSLLEQSNAQVTGRKKVKKFARVSSLTKQSLGRSAFAKFTFGKNKWVRFGLVPLVVIVLVFVVLGGFSINRFLRSNQVAVDQKEWQGTTSLNLLLVGVKSGEGGREFWDSLAIVCFSPDSGKINIVNLDPQLSVNISENYPGSLKTTKVTYQYRQIYNYYKAQAELDPRITNPNVETIRTLQSDLGLKIDRYFKIDTVQFLNLLRPYYYLKVDEQTLALPEQLAYLDTPAKSTDEQLVKQGKLIRLYLQNAATLPVAGGYLLLSWIEPKLNDYFQSDLTNSELLRLYLNLKNYSPSLINNLTTSSKFIYLQGESKFLDAKLFDNELQKNNNSLDLKIEQSRIDVINGSTRKGLAASTARLLSNFGLTIVRLDNSQEIYTKNTLYVANSSNFPETILLLQRLYPDLEIRQYDYPYRPTGDMVLVVI